MARSYITIKVYADTLPVLDVLAALEGVGRAAMIERLVQRGMDEPLTDPDMIAIAERVGARVQERLQDKTEE